MAFSVLSTVLLTSSNTGQLTTFAVVLGVILSAILTALKIYGLRHTDKASFRIFGALLIVVGICGGRWLWLYLQEQPEPPMVGEHMSESAAERHPAGAQAPIEPRQPVVEIDPRIKRVSDFRALLNTDVGISPGKRNIAICIRSDAQMGTVSAAQAFYGHLKDDQAHFITNLFRSDAPSSALFTDLYHGDRDLARMAVERGINYLILGKLDYHFHDIGQIHEGLISCEVVFTGKVFDSTGNTVKEDSFRDAGKGFSQSAALEDAVEELSHGFLERMAKPLM